MGNLGCKYQAYLINKDITIGASTLSALYDALEVYNDTNFEIEIY